MPQPKRPTEISPYAQACLAALAQSGLGGRVSLGGAFGLAHYFQYRTTHDVDAWWVEPVSGVERQTITETLAQALATFGVVRVRSWGDVTSVELLDEKRVSFSFQIAQRSAQLYPPIGEIWSGGIGLDSFDDLVAAKMNALIERGAPRDFRDIYMLCQNGLCTVTHCWAVWQARQSAATQNPDRERGRLALCTHLARLAQARPLTTITDSTDRHAAEQLRAWFNLEFACVFPN